MNRRSFIQGIIGATAGAFIVPEIIVPERRFWSLDRTMLIPKDPYVRLIGIAEPVNRHEATEPRNLSGPEWWKIRLSEVRSGDVFQYADNEGSSIIFWDTGLGIEPAMIRYPKVQ